MLALRRSLFNLTKNHRLIQLPRFKHNFEYQEIRFDNDILRDTDKIERNVKNRKGVGDIGKITKLYNELNCVDINENDRIKLSKELNNEYMKIPNETHPDVVNYEEPKVVGIYNENVGVETDSILEFSEICKKLNIVRTDHLANFSGHKSYYLMSDLVDLEQALIKYTLSELIKHGFQLVSVPDILPDKIINNCGMNIDGERTQVYRLLPSQLCLSGTSEMALAGYFVNASLKEKDLPIKLCAVSRCFRAETSGLNEEKGIYRVHQFTKVEMFSVCQEDKSYEIFDEFRNIEIDLFNNIGLHFKLLDMPPHELGSSAWRKYDIEAWMGGRKMWGEISSCSHCTDYQAKRLNILIERNNRKTLEHAHTINGTACAIPRMLIAIIESFQQQNGTIKIPNVLQKYMKREIIERRKNLPELKLIKSLNLKDKSKVKQNVK